MRNGVDPTYVTEELVPQPFSTAGTSNQSSDVRELDKAGSSLLRLQHFLELTESGIRDRDNANIAVYCCERVI
jgi:hypothetical protein